MTSFTNFLIFFFIYSVICGITLDTQRGHLIRATLEAVCFQVRDVLEAMNSDCGIPLTKLLVDGGMTENNFLMQSQSDIIGIDVIKPAMAETTSLVRMTFFFRKTQFFN